MHLFLMVKTFLLLLLVNFSQATKVIPTKLSDVTLVVHLAERAGHRVMIEYDGADPANPKKKQFVGIGALNTERGWWFTHINKEKFPKDETENFQDDVVFLDDSGAQIYKLKDFWLLHEDFFRYDRIQGDKFTGCKDGDDSEAFHLKTKDGKKYYMAAMRNRDKNYEKTVGTFMYTGGNVDSSFDNTKVGRFLGVDDDGQDYSMEFAVQPAPTQYHNYGWLEFYCKKRHSNAPWGGK